ncbi:DeoR/GlpR family DNA-binding transcription regulator [Vibrio natriegens]|uniref:DeoR/GlpR family DNA-binding transcription regulator n=1 Tax=Vibrio natriegens TaxID=691 RepID=UPI003DA199D3
MLKQLRIRRIAEMAEENGTVMISELIAEFGISKETARRDINALVERRILTRTYGGAIFANRILSFDEPASVTQVTSEASTVSSPSFNDKKGRNIQEKMLLAKRCLPYIKKHDLILLDGGSSSWFLARQLPDMAITVVTNSLEIIQVLAVKSSITTICLGGEYQSEHGAFMGPLVDVALAEFKFDKLFLSCDSLSLSFGLKDKTKATANLKQSMIAASRQVFLIADQSKRDSDDGIYPVVGFNKLDFAALGFTPDDEMLKEFNWSNMKLVT